MKKNVVSPVSRFLKTLSIFVFLFILVSFSGLINTKTVEAAAYNATDVLGQNMSGAPIYTNNLINNTNGADGFTGPLGSVLDSVHHRLFVVDSGFSRVLVFNLDNNNNLLNHTANNVIGQTDFISSAPATTQNGMNNPQGIAYDSTNNRLFVADSTNNRILVFNTTTITNGMNAANVLGQTDFISALAATTQGGMSGPQGLAFDSTGNRLFVADYLNNRVLVFSTATITNGMNAANVLGQAGFITATVATTQNGMSGSQYITYDSTGNRLFVADASNNRVLVFNTTTITNGMNAVNVLGQADFISAVVATTQGGMSYPQGMAFNSAGSRLFVTDMANNRVLVFNTTTITNGMNAANVLGQADFISAVIATTQNGMNAPRGVTFDSGNNRLYVADTTNNRITIFNTTIITNNMNAVNVLGQSDYLGNSVYTTSNGNNSKINPTGFSFNNDVLVDTTYHRLFVVDTNNNRVLVFNLDNSNNLLDYTADFVLGQNDFVSNLSATTQNGMRTPQRLAFDSAGNRLFVADSSNNRVLVFNTSTITNGMNAANVLGQTDFISAVIATTQNSINFPRGIVFDSSGNRLFVADSNSNRVIVFNTTTITDGMNASNVLGQADFISALAATTQGGMSGPQGVSFDSTNHRLFVSDTFNNRVLVFNTTTITDGMNASNVLGQADFVSALAATTQSGVSSPRGSVFDSSGNHLILGDYSNNRILVFNTATITNGMNAVGVLGQADFISSTLAVTQNGIKGARGLCFDSGNNRLYVADLNNNRVLIYNFVKITQNSVADAIKGQPYNQSFSTVNSQGTVTLSLTSGSVPSGLTLGASLSGTSSAGGNYSFTIRATDTLTGVGAFNSLPVSYTMALPVGGGGLLTNGTSVSVPSISPAQTMPTTPTIKPTTPAPVVISTPTFTQILACGVGDKFDGNTGLPCPSVKIPSQSCSITQVLKVGSRGDQVRCLQKGLQLTEDGFFGKKTKTAVIKFQKLNKLISDGIVGPSTIQALNKNQ